MTLTVQLSKELETLLTADAQREKRPVEEIAEERISSFYEPLDSSDPVAIEAIQESLEDIEAGREIGLEEYILHRNAEREARRAGQGVK